MATMRVDETDGVAGIRWVDYAAFYRDTEPRLRRALVAACGVDAGMEAAAQAMEVGFERWADLRTMENPAGYLYRVGRNAARDRRKPLPTVVAEEAERYGFEPALDVSVSTLRNHLSRGLAHLRRQLGVAVGDSPEDADDDRESDR